MDKAFVTLATNDPYCLGALVVATSLRTVDTRHAIVCMITPDVTSHMRDILERAFDQVYLVDVLDSRDTKNLFLLERPDLGVTFTKLHCWRLEQYKKCVFLDADTLVLKNCDELFEREEFSAAPDPGWPDCFNSGVFVYTPSKDTYNKLVQFAVEEGSFDGGDQGLLNLYFNDWAHTDISKHLPFIYNVVSQAFYSYLPAFRRFGSETKICHFIGPVKPWNHTYDHNTGAPKYRSGTGFNADFLNRWWQIFISNVLPLIESISKSLARNQQPEESSTKGVCQTPQQVLENHGQESNIQSHSPNSETSVAKVSAEFEDNINTESIGKSFTLPVTDFLSSVSHRSLSSVALEVLVGENEAEKCSKTLETLEISHVPEIHQAVEIPKESESEVMQVSGIPKQSEIPKDDLYSMWNDNRVPYYSPQCSFDSILAHINKSISGTDSVKDWGDVIPAPPVTNQDALVPQLSGLSLSSGGNTPILIHKSTQEHQGDWERGIIDYTGVDSFENIKHHLDRKLAENQPPPPPQYVIPTVSQATLSAGAAAGAATISTVTTAIKASTKPIKGVLKKTKSST